MHILWIREHNRIAEKLLELNPTWNDEMLYQEARRIVVAEWQHITYSEWLPMLFGKKLSFIQYKIFFDFYIYNCFAYLGNSYDKYFSSYDNNGYDEQADPSITNSASTTALRFFYSLLDGTINLMNEERDLNETIVLMEHFNRPKILTKPQKLEQILRGMTSQPSQSMDLHLVDDVTQLFFRSINSDTGLDVLSMDIQRGRDHGLPPYYSFKVMCNQKPVTDFNDFDDVMSESSIQKLRKLYTSAFDVDLLVGALAEEPKEGSFMGPTLECLLGEIFKYEIISNHTELIIN